MYQTPKLFGQRAKSLIKQDPSNIKVHAFKNMTVSGSMQGPDPSIRK